MPTRIFITLSETPVIYLLHINSTTGIKGTEEGALIEKFNAIYDFLTSTKGRNRKILNSEVQTSLKILKNRATIAKDPSKDQKFSFASQWDMFDTLNKKDVEKPKVGSSKNGVPGDLQMKKLLKNQKFQLALLVTERALANNIFNWAQKIFRGLIFEDPFRPQIKFQYGLRLLWTFKNKKVQEVPLTCLEWNPKNGDILASGYGKFHFGDPKKGGQILIWNIKNPTQPEREYFFKNPVTSLTFSKFEPNLLAVGLYDGTVALLDISPKEVQLIMETDPTSRSSFDPIWDLAWVEPEPFNINENHLISVSEDGVVSSYVATKSNDFLRLGFLKASRIENKLQGVYLPKKCASNDFPLSKNAQALKILKHPIESGIFFIGTGDGIVQKCSENYKSQNFEAFVAHNGPIYNLQFSNFCTKLFLSCGADSCIRLWLEGLTEPVASLMINFDPIDGAEFSPTNSTIIANICQETIYIWDLQRKTYEPVSEIKNPSKCRNTVLKFSQSGTNLAVGDVEGNLHIFSFYDFPFPPFYQSQFLEEVLHRNLIRKPDLMEKVKKILLI